MRIALEAEVEAGARGRTAVAYLLLWLSGLSLRVTILAVPPVIHLVRSDWRLSGTEVGLLVTLPTALFAVAAVPGALLVGRLGPVRTLVLGLAVTALGSTLRAIAPGMGALLAVTAVMAAGVAVMQPALPALVRRWAPSRIGLATAVFTNGLLVGEILPVALTQPLVLPLVPGWRASLAVWSAPVVVAALLVGALAPAVRGEAGGAATVARGRPAWRSGVIWMLGLLFGSINALYFATNAFLPGLLGARGRPDLIGPALTALNAGQLPAAFLMLGVAGRLERRGAPFVAAGALALAALAGMLASPGRGVVAWAAVLGFVNSAALVLALALPALLRPPEEVAATSAAMFTISYGGALLLALASGAAWDLTGDPRAAFGPVCACAVTLAGAALALRVRGRLS